MTDSDIALFIQMNEPTFDYGGKQYSVCSPDGMYSTWDSDGNTFDFSDIGSLLDRWVVGGRPFRDVVQTIM